MYKYSLLYSGKKPKLYEDDIFKTEIPIDENFSADFGISSLEHSTYIPNKKSLREQNIISAIKKNPYITQNEIMQQTGFSKYIVQTTISNLQQSGNLIREGSKKDGRWIVK